MNFADRGAYDIEARFVRQMREEFGVDSVGDSAGDTHLVAPVPSTPELFEKSTLELQSALAPAALADAVDRAKKLKGVVSKLAGAAALAAPKQYTEVQDGVETIRQIPVSTGQYTGSTNMKSAPLPDNEVTIEHVARPAARTAADIFFAEDRETQLKITACVNAFMMPVALGFEQSFSSFVNPPNSIGAPPAVVEWRKMCYSTQQQLQTSILSMHKADADPLKILSEFIVNAALPFVYITRSIFDDRDVAEAACTFESAYKPRYASYEAFSEAVLPYICNEYARELCRIEEERCMGAGAGASVEPVSSKMDEFEHTGAPARGTGRGKGKGKGKGKSDDVSSSERRGGTIKPGPASGQVASVHSSKPTKSLSQQQKLAKFAHLIRRTNEQDLDPAQAADAASDETNREFLSDAVSRWSTDVTHNILVRKSNTSPADDEDEPAFARTTEIVGIRTKRTSEMDAASPRSSTVSRRGSVPKMNITPEDVQPPDERDVFEEPAVTSCIETIKREMGFIRQNTSTILSGAGTGIALLYLFGRSGADVPGLGKIRQLINMSNLMNHHTVSFVTGTLGVLATSLLNTGIPSLAAFLAPYTSSTIATVQWAQNSATVFAGSASFTPATVFEYLVNAGMLLSSTNANHVRWLNVLSEILKLSSGMAQIPGSGFAESVIASVMLVVSYTLVRVSFTANGAVCTEHVLYILGELVSLLADRNDSRMVLLRTLAIMGHVSIICARTGVFTGVLARIRAVLESVDNRGRATALRLQNMLGEARTRVAAAFARVHAPRSSVVESLDLAVPSGDNRIRRRTGESAATNVMFLGRSLVSRQFSPSPMMSANPVGI